MSEYCDTWIENKAVRIKSERTLGNKIKEWQI